MKKGLLILGMLAGLSQANAASFGLSSGYPLSGIHYQVDNATGATRYTLGYGFYGGIEGSYERLTNMPANGTIQPYWGAGVSVGTGLNTYYGGLFSVGANGLVGAKLNLIPQFDVFGELGAGAKYWLGSNSYYAGGLRPSIGARIGFNYNLR